MTIKSVVVIDGEKIEIKDLEDKDAFADRVNVGQNLTIDTDRQLAYRSDGTLNNTAVTGNYEDLVLVEGDNKVTITDGFDLKVIPYWRYL